MGEREQQQSDEGSVLAALIVVGCVIGLIFLFMD